LFWKFFESFGSFKKLKLGTGVCICKRVLRRERYDSLPTTSPWDDSLPIEAEYPRHVRGVAVIGAGDLVRGVYENQYTNGEREDTGKTIFQNAFGEGITELDDENQSYEYTDEYRYSAGGTRVTRSGSQNVAAGNKADRQSVLLKCIELCVIHDVVCALALMVASSFSQLRSASLRQLWVC
jgi:hypothetical protein